MLLRTLAHSDRPAVLALNQASVSELSALDAERLDNLLAIARRALVVESDGVVIAFALAMAPASGYESLNYRWFQQRFERFLYLDRIAVAAGHRRRGAGALLYEDMEDAAGEFGRMVCDVNIEPPNDPSLAFHERRGYRRIGRLEHPEKVVALLSKELAPTARAR
jgi:predicted GNAT superfamily acetyltransferase